jgi:cation diffusion facilitator CzcD-associated flavoprotein CzcO
VVVIGSGATAATIIPAIAEDSAHVTMLQRSPTFFITGRNVVDLAETLRQLQVDETWIHEIVRRKILFDQATFTRRCIEEPDVVKKELIGAIRNLLGPDYDVDAHFTPTYRPWRQRIAFVPDADLFKSISSGKASVMTDEIERFTETGLLLKSGKQLDADIIVAATGFNISVLGDIDFVIDGKPLVFSDSVTYRGMMFTGIPNLAWVFGYFRRKLVCDAEIDRCVGRIVLHIGKSRTQAAAIYHVGCNERFVPAVGSTRRGTQSCMSSV